MWRLKLTRRERNRLEAVLKGAPSNREYRRVLTVLSVADGVPIAQIAQVLRVDRVSIYNWLKSYTGARDPDALGDRYHGSRAVDWTDKIVVALKAAMETTPDACGYKAVSWTAPLLLKHIEKACELKTSTRTISRLLQGLNFVWKRPRHVLQGAKSPRVSRCLCLIRKKVRDLPAGCAKLFEDETDLLFFPPLRAGWFQRGKPAEVPITGWNAKRTVFGTMDVESGRRTFVVRPGICAPDFHADLRAIRKAYGTRKVVLLLDKASRHTAHSSEQLAAELDIALIWLPPRCANINPVDRLWRWGKEKVCANRQHADIDAQAKMFVEYLMGLSPEEALRMAGMRSGKFWLFRGSAPVATTDSPSPGTS
jgi:transposase